MKDKKTSLEDRTINKVLPSENEEPPTNIIDEIMDTHY